MAWSNGPLGLYGPRLSVWIVGMRSLGDHAVRSPPTNREEPSYDHRTTSMTTDDFHPGSSGELSRDDRREAGTTKQYRLTWATRLINRPFAWLARHGLGADYRYVLTVRGRRSGKPYSTPVDAIEHGERRWLVAPYGVTNWVRNARAAGEVELRRGDRTERLRVQEASKADAAPVIRRYLELVPVTRPYFAVSSDASDDALAAEAERHPVFRLDPLAADLPEANTSP